MYLYAKNVKQKSSEILFGYSSFNMVLLNEGNTYMFLQANNVFCDIALKATFALKFN